MEGWQEVDKYFVLYAGTAGMLLLCGGMLLFFRAYHIRLMKEQEEKSKMELAHKDQLLYANIEATEKERARIARDLHDEVGASLSLLRMQVSDNTDAKPVIDTAIDNVRRISYDLLPPTLEAFGLTAALQAFLDKTQAATGIHIHTSLLDDERFDALTELSVYRVIQELVHNTVKHSGAAIIDIVMQYVDGILYVSYRDNGRGYDHAMLRKENGLGLKNIELRIQQCGGTVQYQTNNDDSITMKATIPAKIRES